MEQETPILENVEQELAIVEQQQRQQLAEEVEQSANVLQFMDSLDAYLTLIHSLSSTLRQGWLDLASARHSMGVSRVNTVLLDHKFHPASTSLLVTQDEEKGIHQFYLQRQSVDSMEPRFTLCKWASSGNEKLSLGETQSDQDKVQPQLRRRGGSQLFEEKTLYENKASHQVDQVQRERCKSLSVFGTLVSPKLRAAQLSFETALETLVEIANMRSTMLCAFDKVHKTQGGSKG